MDLHMESWRRKDQGTLLPLKHLWTASVQRSLTPPGALLFLSSSLLVELLEGSEELPAWACCLMNQLAAGPYTS